MLNRRRAFARRKMKWFAWICQRVFISHRVPITRRRTAVVLCLVCSSLTAILPVAQASRSRPGQSAEEKQIAMLEPGQVVDREISGGQFHVYEISMTAGQCVSLVVHQQGIDIAIAVLDSDNNVTADFDSQKSKQRDEQALLVADTTTKYRFRVRAIYRGAPAGRYQLQSSKVRPVEERDRTLFEANRSATTADQQMEAGKYDDAISAGARALELAEKALGPDDAYIGFLLIGQAIRVRTKGDVSNAEVMFQRAIDIDRKTLGDEDPQTALAIGDMGLIYLSRNDYAGAALQFQKGYEISERTLGPDDPQVALFLMNLSTAHSDRGDFQTAETELKRCIAISEKMRGPEDPLTLKMIYNLGNMYLDTDDSDRAEPLMQAALTGFEKQFGPDHPNLAYPLQNLGILARRHKQYNRALEYLWRSEQIREKSVGRRHRLVASLFVNIGNVYHAQGNYAKAMELFLQGLDIYESVAGPYDPHIIDTLSAMARTSAAMKDLDRAYEYQSRVDVLVEKSLSLNLEVGSEREKLAYMSIVEKYVSDSISLSVQQSPSDKRAAEGAATAVLQRKGRVLDALAGSVAALREHLSGGDQQLLDELSVTTSDLAKLALNGPKKTPLPEYRSQIHALEEKRETLEAQISQRSQGYYESSTAVTLASISSLIPQDAVLVEFAVYQPLDPKVDEETALPASPRYVAYVISQSGDLRWVDLGESTEIDKLAQSWREALSSPTRTDSTRIARELDRKTMKHVREVAGNVKHLLISPDGELNLIPFEALVDENGSFLVQRYSISYLTTGRDLLRLQVARSSKSGPLVIANPLFGEPQPDLIAKGGSPNVNTSSSVSRRRSVTIGADLETVYFAPLPGTAMEARTIQSLFPDTRLLSGAQASKASLKLVDAPKILHFATHGFFLRDLPASPGSEARVPTVSASSSQRPAAADSPLLRSGLALSGANLTKGNSEDGILTSLEASSLNLWGTRLVALSACETGVGKVKNGEGVYGLRRAFFLAGTETLLMSLWEVSDQATREMMTSYYKGLKAGLGRGEALRQTQLDMLKRKGRQHPYYWASFIQAGEWANLDGKR
jgi:CHAT domain-containing protein